MKKKEEESMMKDAKKILITGGAGFIGSNFVHYLIRKYPHLFIINLDKLTYAGNINNIADLEGNKNHLFIKGDICDKELVNDLIKDIDILINFAAETHVDRSIMEAGEFLRTDVFGTFVLLEASKKEKIKLFVQISTDEVYGSIEKGYADELAPLMPSNPYSASKAAADRLAFSYWQTYKLPVIITRCCNNYGPFQHPEKFIPLFITNALEDKYLPLYGDGLNVRDWIYIEDHCRALDFIINKGVVGEVYNISAKQFFKNIEVSKLILSYLKKSESLIKYVKDRPGHDRRYAISNKKLLKLGWKPLVPFKEGLKKTIDWYIKNKEWWKTIKEKDKDFIEYYQKQYKGI